MDLYERIFRGRSLASDSAGRRNSIGFLRLMLAAFVVVSHSRVLGFNLLEPGEAGSHLQTDLGKLGVFGFFVISGYLISASGMRIRLGRFLWHRFLRIFPGLWMCLLLMAFVMAPLVALHLHGNLHHFWHQPDSPFHFLAADWWTGLRQTGVSGLRVNPITGIFDGALWSLSYEMLGYLAIAVLSVTAVLTRAPKFLIFLLAACWLYMLHYQLDAHTWRGAHPVGININLPLLGVMTTGNLLYLGFMFVLGVVAQLYKDRISTHGAVAGAALVVLLASMKIGGFFVFGLPAYGYLVLWVAMRLRGPFQKVGRKHDYSYGLYIYAWPVQDLLSMEHATRWGLLAYTLLALAGGLVMAVFSWHAVESQAMRLKDWTPGFLRGRAAIPEPRSADVAVPESAAEPTVLPAIPAQTH
ncbi:acyltransferase family protein [Actinospica robiniae]|uniref:acyltransferase family protein n=1 Tax=Actinospica robiniae TaxID=304901 RepID=UPI000686CCAD|nr:acyltransferase [Actinospica robiniae]